MIAYFTKTPKQCFLTILDTVVSTNFADGQRVDVADKRAARAYCKANGIKPWNF